MKTRLRAPTLVLEDDVSIVAESKPYISDMVLIVVRSAEGLPPVMMIDATEQAAMALYTALGRALGKGEE
jgi:hypothetical protein